MLFVTVFVGCSGSGDESYTNVAAVHPNTWNPVVHFSDEGNGSWCMPACANMHRFYGGETFVPLATIMEQGDIDYPSDGFMTMYEYIQYFYTYSSQTMEQYAVPMISGDAQADINNLANNTANAVDVGATPLFAFYNVHGIIVGGYSYDDGTFEITHLIVFDPATPDETREKAIQVRKKDFHKKVHAKELPNGWAYPFVAQWNLMASLPMKPRGDSEEVFQPLFIVKEPLELETEFLAKRYPPIPFIPFDAGNAGGLDPETYEDTVKCYADTALFEWVANSPQEAVARFGSWLGYPIHIGPVTASSWEHWPREGDLKITAGPNLYMWVCEIISDYDDELLGAVLLSYVNIDSTLSIVSIPPRSMPDGSYKLGQSRASLKPIKAKEIQAVHKNKPFLFGSNRYLGVVSSCPDLDIGIWGVIDSSSGDPAFYDYFGNELELSSWDGRLSKTGKRFSEVTENQNRRTLPVKYKLGQNYPNPFNPTTQIGFAIPEPSHVIIEVFNITGQRVATIVDDFMATGAYTVNWDGSDQNGNKVASGIYLYRLTAGTHILTKKMVMLK
jgi:hypothetical protein